MRSPIRDRTRLVNGGHFDFQTYRVNGPRGLSRFDTLFQVDSVRLKIKIAAINKTRTISNWRSHGKTEDCEQSNDIEDDECSGTNFTN